MITKEEYVAYERVRLSGVTNMFDVKTVMILTGLTQEKILEIIEHYGELMKQYPEVRGHV